MKISDLNQRVQGFYAIHKEEDDGEFTVNYHPCGWFWAKITPKNCLHMGAKSQAEQGRQRYEVVMHKDDIYHTGHAYISRLSFNQKYLDIQTPWLEIQGMHYASGFAVAKDGGNDHG